MKGRKEGKTFIDQLVDWFINQMTGQYTDRKIIKQVEQTDHFQLSPAQNRSDSQEIMLLIAPGAMRKYENILLLSSLSVL